MSRWISASSSPNRNSASALASSVFPTPVGPAKMNDPPGRLGSFRPARVRRMAWDSALTACCWPTTRLCSSSSMCSSRLDSSSVSLNTGIPVFKLTEEESSRLLHMEDELHKRVVGQQQAVKALSQAIRRTRAGLKDPKRPGGSFIFAGPTGVGKTELARALAEFLFGDEDALIQLDMSEFSEKHTVSR